MNSKQCQSPKTTVSIKLGHKTPQSQRSGINKALLTPCRRMGLKRKSPFHSGNMCNSVKFSPQLKHKCDDSSPQFHNSNKVIIGDDENTNDVSLTHVDMESNDHKTPKRKYVSNKIKTENLSTKLIMPSPQNSLTTNITCDAQNQGTNTPSKCRESFNPPVEEFTEKMETPIEHVTEEALVKIRQRIKEKEEKVNKIKLAQLYRKKHDLNRLTQLTEKWRKGCQEALMELLDTSCSRGHQVNMSQLLAQLGIPHDLVGYNQDSDQFH